eukprot:768352-Pyramimonas_sp.AAC.1
MAPASIREALAWITVWQFSGLSLPPVVRIESMTLEPPLRSWPLPEVVQAIPPTGGHVLHAGLCARPSG